MIHFRNAKASDAETILEFQLKMARETEELELDREICSRGVAAVLGDPSKGTYFVAEKEGRVIASLMITYEWSDWRDGNVWWIQSVWVEPEFRRQGIYARLYNHVKSIVQSRSDIRGIRLYVDHRNGTAQEVYGRLGMNGEHYRVFEWMK
jgi:ribosomal protein S18 acetylase RimI-like enzyme